LRHGRLRFAGLRLDLHANVLEPAFVREFRERADGFEPDVLLVT
jgi:hypothetical protein